MNPLGAFLDRLTSRAVGSASAAAQAEAEAQWEQARPYVMVAAAIVSFMALTTWLFYFLPRFASPFRRAR